MWHPGHWCSEDACVLSSREVSDKCDQLGAAEPHPLPWAPVQMGLPAPPLARVSHSAGRPRRLFDSLHLPPLLCLLLPSQACVHGFCPLILSSSIGVFSSTRRYVQAVACSPFSGILLEAHCTVRDGGRQLCTMLVSCAAVTSTTN